MRLAIGGRESDIGFEIARKKSRSHQSVKDFSYVDFQLCRFQISAM